MAYRIAVDSCTDLTPELKQNPNVFTVPLVLTVGDEEIIDDDTFDQASYLKKVAACPEAPSSACPSPGAFMDIFGDDDVDAYAITLSGELSGSYNSAMQGKRMIQEDLPKKNIHVFNSRSAAVGQTLILIKLLECLEKGMAFKDVVVEVETYIREQNTAFVLETLDTFRKNGRLSGVKATIVEVLNIKPVMVSTPEGNVRQAGKGRGMKKALESMIDYVKKSAKKPEGKTIGIAHCNCPERAEWLKQELEKLNMFTDVLIVETAGVSSTYANDGGIIIAY